MRAMPRYFRSVLAAALLLVSVGCCSAQLSKEKSGPTLPYLDWGACTFECCSYGKWEAVRPTVAYKSRDENGRVSFKSDVGQKVMAVAGVVVTSTFGMTEVLKPMRMGYTKQSGTPQLSLKNGDILYTLHYAGEASDAFWYKGKVYVDQIDVPDDAMGTAPDTGALKVLSRSEYAWWIKIKDSQGRIGWTRQAENFSGPDRCS